MKTLKISDEAHRKLTAILGRLMAQTGKMKTYSEAIEAVMNESVMLSPELLGEIDEFIRKNEQLGFTTREELMQDAIRSKLVLLSGEDRHAC